MLVKEMSKIIEENWFTKAPSLDKVSAEVIIAARRGSVTTVTELLKYIDAVCATSSKSAHVLFIKLMNQLKPEFSYWSSNKFFIDNSLKKYTDALYNLYLLDESGAGSNYVVANGLNVYTKLFHVYNNLYINASQPYTLYDIDENHTMYIRYLFGTGYIKELTYPSETVNYDMAWLFNHKNIVLPKSPILLVDITTAYDDYKPLSDNRIINYCKTDVSNGVIITLVHKAKVNIKDLPIAKLIHEAYAIVAKGFKIKEIDNYRLNIFIPNEC